MRRSGVRSRSRGFTLLEAIVAMVILASAGVAVFAWINSNLSSLQRVRDANFRSEALVNALEYMDRVNPMATPEGRANLGPYFLQWRSEALAPPVDGAGYPSGLGLYQLALYGTTVKVKSAEDRDWFEIQLKQVGFKRVRSDALRD